jgi:rod shape-determining protein MreC
MDTFMGRYRNVTILAAAIFLQILGLAVQIKRSTENESSRLIRLWAVTMVAPLEKGIVRVQSTASGVWHNYFYLRGVRQENRDLRQQLEQLRLEQVRLKQDADQAHRLQALLEFKEQFVGATAAAQVIGTSGSEQSRIVYIDKGFDDGIKNAMPVITSDGVVGRVLSVIDGNTSQVLLISDQQSGVGAIVDQSRLQGVLKGRPSGELVIDKIMNDEDVKPGDRILTSGGDRIFPKGLPVGTITRISKGAEFLQLTVKPAAALNHLEEVLVITKKEQRDAPASTSTPTRAADILAQRLPQVPDKPAIPVSSTPATTTPKAGTPAGTTPNTGAPAATASNGELAPATSAAAPVMKVNTGLATGTAAAPVLKKPPSPGSALELKPSAAAPAQPRPTTASSAQPKPLPKTDAPAATKPAEPKSVTPDPNSSQGTPPQ